MSKTISDRLAQASKTSFVGRKAEFDLLLNSLEYEELPFQVAFIHGMGGIGKTHLVKALINALNKEIQAVAILSGLLRSQTRRVEAVYAGHGFRREDKVELGEWASLMLRKG